ncbi:MAG: ABC transporter permease, partial [Sphingobacterium sp.]
ELGFNYQSVININLPYKKSQQGDVDPYTFKQALTKYPNIHSVSLGHLPMSDDYWGNYISRTTNTGEVKVGMPLKYVDEDYVKVYDLKILAGRAVTLADTMNGIVLNAMAVQALGFKTPQTALGKTINFNEQKRSIVGVIDNFHVKNLHTKMEPLSIISSAHRGQLQKISIRLNGGMETWPLGLANLEKEWKNFYPDAPFAYEFYDQKIKNYYEQDYKFSKIINLATGITILLSCLGLLGLVTITSAQRTKEIGIRKVMGSTISGIVGLLSKDYIKLVFISVLIASPIAWWAVKTWLADFAYKIELSWWMFTIPAVATLIVAFLTMSYQSVKAAKANPVDSLRDE